MPLKKDEVIAAEILLELKCINFSPKKQFKLTSGKKVPFTVTVDDLYLFQKEMKTLISLAVKTKIFNDFKKITNISGGESAGIPFASLIASKLEFSNDLH